MSDRCPECGRHSPECPLDENHDGWCPYASYRSGYEDGAAVGMGLLLMALAIQEQQREKAIEARRRWGLSDENDKLREMAKTQQDAGHFHVGYEWNEKAWPRR